MENILVSVHFGSLFLVYIMKRVLLELVGQSVLCKCTVLCIEVYWSFHGWKCISVCTLCWSISNRLLSTIDGNVEFVHSQYSCILTSQVSIRFLCPTKLLIIVIILE